nr:mediator of RNA polymerase II transcription subunit 15A-like [Ipomoea batatas]
MKEIYWVEVIKLYKKAKESCLESVCGENDQVQFLQMFKVDFIQHSKEKVCQYMNLITNYLDEVRMKNSAALQKHRSAATSARAFLLNSSGEVSIKGCEAAETLSTRTEIFKIANLDSTLSNRDHATSLPANTVNPLCFCIDTITESEATYVAGNSLGSPLTQLQKVMQLEGQIVTEQKKLTQKSNKREGIKAPKIQPEPDKLDSQSINTVGAHNMPLVMKIRAFTQQPKRAFERLLDAIGSISKESFRASVCDIGNVVNMIDMRAGTLCYPDYRGSIGDDLMDDFPEMLVLHLLVLGNYPKPSPIVLDKSPDLFSTEEVRNGYRAGSEAKVQLVSPSTF